MANCSGGIAGGSSERLFHFWHIPVRRRHSPGLNGCDPIATYRIKRRDFSGGMAEFFTIQDCKIQDRRTLTGNFRGQPACHVIMNVLGILR
jgi:hypothetical protein